MSAFYAMKNSSLFRVENAFYLIDDRFSYVCPIFAHEFPHNIIKVAVDPQSGRQTHKTNVFYHNKLSNCAPSLSDAPHKLQIHVSVRLVTMKISQ